MDEDVLVVSKWVGFGPLTEPNGARNDREAVGKAGGLSIADR
jgi:hypothetical protein